MQGVCGWNRKNDAAAAADGGTSPAAVTVSVMLIADYPGVTDSPMCLDIIIRGRELAG